MRNLKVLVVFLCLLFSMKSLHAQDLKTSIGNNKELDSLRAREENKKDSVVFTSKYIRYTTLALTKDSIQTFPIDTSLVGIQNFSAIVQPKSPTVNNGVLGLPARPMLFDPRKNIGFDPGFHTLDYYKMTHDDVRFYRARSQFTSLSYVNAGDNEQVFKIIHSQNIKKNWNAGANFNRIGANGAYSYQRGDDLNAAIFTMYQSPNKRYNLWSDIIFNTLKVQENGSLLNDTIFSDNSTKLVDRLAESIKLDGKTTRQLYRNTSFLFKHSYFVGRIDTTKSSSADNVLPTNRITHTFLYDKSSFNFRKDEVDKYGVFPASAVDATFSNDSTNVKHIQNEFMYSFYLRGKGEVIKNEVKVDAGIRHDYYAYHQYGILADTTYYYHHQRNFQNLTLLGQLAYRFSNKVDVSFDVQQLFQGRQAGDFLYEARANVMAGKKLGKIVLSAYQQNKSPEEMYSRFYGTYYNWNLGALLDRTKTTNFTFRYLNDALNLDASASYYLVDGYLYFGQGAEANSIIPIQESSPINLLQVKIGKKFSLGSFHLDVFGVYQKSDSKGILRTPEFYTFNSLYKDQTFFKALKTQIGFDVRYNTAFPTVSYAIPMAQFYNGDNISFTSYPIVDVWVKAGLRRANLFAKYEYANQGLLSNGYYLVNRYPQQDRILKVGLTWNFYD